MRRHLILAAMMASVVLPVSAQPPDGHAVRAPVSSELRAVEVIASTPLPGSGIDIDKVPSNVQTLSARDLDRDSATAIVANEVGRRLASVDLNNEQGSEFQPDLVYRGFEASPIEGVAQGIAVYQNGVRLNESFGDTVNWDLVPQVAIGRLTVQGNNTVFGLNALGGAVTLEMKNGFDFSGGDLHLKGGSYGNLNGHGQLALRRGDVAFYAAVNGLEDDGFRYHSPTALHQVYLDLGYEDGRSALHLAVSAARNDIAAVGPAPVQLLQRDPRSVFTYPQSMHNEAELVSLSGLRRLTPSLQLNGVAYYRHFLQRLRDGNTTDVQACGNNAAYFCLGGSGDYPGDALYDAQGVQVPVSVLPAGATPGEVDRINTNANTAGATAQLSWNTAGAGLNSHFTAGFSFDQGEVHYGARGELGSIAPDLRVDGAGVTVDQAYSSTAQPPLEQPVAVRVRNTYYGLYATDTLDLTPALAWTLSARINLARISLRDRIGNNLNADHRFDHVNPGTGLSYRLGSGLTAYLGYTQSNRAPTAGELSCADPQRPCLTDAFLVSDPDLKQVVAQTFELGVRGSLDAPWGEGRLRWNLGLYRTGNRNDIILLATPINGFGYYANAGGTRRQGIEAGLKYRIRRLDLSLGYSLTDATFRDPLTLSSNSPSAGDAGDIHVVRGNRLPLVPLHRATLDLDYQLGTRWSVGGDLRYVDSQFLAGDQSNQQPRLPPYLVAGARASWRLTPTVRLSCVVDNLFDRRYYTYGAFSGLSGLPPGYASLSDPRSFSPSPGRTFSVGLTVDF